MTRQGQIAPHLRFRWYIFALASSWTCEAINDSCHTENTAQEAQMHSRALMQTASVRSRSSIRIHNSSLLQAAKPAAGRSKNSGKWREDKYKKKPPKSNKTSHTEPVYNRTLPSHSRAARALGGIVGLSHMSYLPTRLLLVFAIGFGIIAILIVSRLLISRGSPEFGDTRSASSRTRANQSLANDAYGQAIMSLIWESYLSALGYKRFGRIMQGLFIVGLNIAIQVYILLGIKHWICSKAVHDIRRVYDTYETRMYGLSHTTLEKNGDHRGTAQFFRPEVFHSLPDTLKEDVCSIPFSQPAFFITALFIWTLTCFDEVKTAMELFINLIVMTPSLTSMSEALSSPEAGSGGEFTSEAPRIVQGLTVRIKAVIAGCVLIPRAAVTILLLWLGCRWLAATSNFMDLILNAVALGFLLGMKDLVYQALVPEWNKRDVERIEIAPPTEKEPPGYWALFGTLQWACIALIWVLVYVFLLQSVLPGYRWDVRAVCSDWMAHHFSETTN